MTVLKLDPSRTLSARRAFVTTIRKKFALLRGRVRNYGLVFNANPYHDEEGKFASGSGFASQHNPAFTYHYEDDRNSDDAHFTREISKANADVAKAKAALKEAMDRGTDRDPVVIALRAALAHADKRVEDAKALVEQAKQPSSRFLAKQAKRDARIKHLKSLLAANAASNEVTKFQNWLRDQYKDLGLDDEQLWLEYAKQGFMKGAGRAFDDARKQGWNESEDFFAGSKQEFLRGTLSAPESVEKIKALASRSFTDLQNVTQDMSTRMTRTLADGLVRGANPHEIADDLVEDMDMPQARAETIARTEIIRAHAEGQLDAFDNLGVTEVGVEVEWSTAGDDRVCEECASMEGAVYSIDDAHGLIPAHPNCRCCFLPAVGPIGNMVANCGGRGGRPGPCPGERSSAPSHQTSAAQKLALQKAKEAPKPTEAEIERANERMNEMGADRYEADIRGNSYARAASRENLLKQFGNGKTCPCVYCGLKLDSSTVTRDKIVVARKGGTYKLSNLVPACLPCNQQRGDQPFKAFMAKAMGL